jgi:hypothetical protein
MNILEITESFFDLPQGTLNTRTRKRPYIVARQMLSSVLYQECMYTYTMIARIHDRHHATIMHHVGNHLNTMSLKTDDTNAEYLEDVIDYQNKYKDFKAHILNHEELVKVTAHNFVQRYNDLVSAHKKELFLKLINDTNGLTEMV